MNEFIKTFKYESSYWEFWDWAKFIVSIIIFLIIFCILLLVILAIIKWSFNFIFY